MDLQPEDLRLLKPSEIEWLNALAAERGISLEAYIELLVRQYVDKN